MKEPTEAQIQADFFRWLDLNSKRYPQLSLFYAIPNGAHKSPAARGLFKATGLKAGVPDCHLPIKSGPTQIFPYNGLWIEFKSKKGRLSAAQEDWIEQLRIAGHCVVVCRTWTDAVNITTGYLGLDIPRL